MEMQLKHKIMAKTKEKHFCIGSCTKTRTGTSVFYLYNSEHVARAQNKNSGIKRMKE